LETGLLKLLIIHQAFVSPDMAGGTRHFEFARHIASDEIQTSIVASDVSYLTGQRVDRCHSPSTLDSFDNVTVLRARTLSTLHQSFWWRIASFLSFMATSSLAGLRCRDVDVVMGTSPPIFQAISAWLVSAIKRKPYLLEIRDLWPEFAVAMGILRNPLLVWLSRQLERFLYSRAEHLLVNSPAYVDYLVRKGIDRRRITLIPNGTDPSVFRPDVNGATTRNALAPDSRIVVTYAGALGPANDIQTVLRAALVLKDRTDIRILLVGDGKDRPSLEKTARDLGLHNVTFHGPVPKGDMPEVLAASDACIAILKGIPMFSTTYPNKVFDYMAAGKPVLLAIDGVIREVVEQAGAGVFVPPGDAEALAGAILNLADDETLRKQMGAAGRSVVVSEYDRAVHAEAFRSLVLKTAQVRRQ
jgi:glycosyltransferase involved in cell wall biosynthesis